MRPARAVALLAAAVVVLTAPSAAAQTYDDALELSWTPDGPFVDELTVPVFPGPRVVPGDSDSRSFVVRNAGPGAGVLTAEIVDVELAGDLEDPFYEDFHVAGGPVVDLYGHDTLVLSEVLAAGETTTVELDYGFPLESTSGNYPAEGTVQVELDLRLRIQGDTPTGDVAPQDTLSPGATPPGLPVTGSPTLGIVVGALAAFVIGVSARTVRRTRP
jgi:hypothetical protein